MIVSLSSASVGLACSFIRGLWLEPRASNPDKLCRICGESRRGWRCRPSQLAAPQPLWQEDSAEPEGPRHASTGRWRRL